jgi:Holliday junction resolvase RusA-like endonuclease
MRFIELKVDPNAKPRMTKRDRWAKRPVVNQYFAFKDLVCIEAKKLGLETLPDDIASLTFVVKMPDSWSTKKKYQMIGTGKQSRPDLDNYLKGLQDALCKEDKGIWHIGDLKKVWGNTGKIIIGIEDSV